MNYRALIQLSTNKHPDQRAELCIQIDERSTQ